MVIGIIALLISILLPALGKARAAAMRTKCMANHKTLMQAVAQYANMFDGYGPPAEFNDGASGRWIIWPNRELLGQFIGNKTYSKEEDDRGGVWVCPSYNRPSRRSDNVGIGIIKRNGSLIARSEGSTPTTRQQKFTRIRNTTRVIMFVDVYSGSGWEKFYYNDPGSTSMGNNTTGMVSYRHRNSTVVSFADGHAESFQSNSPTLQAESTTGFNVGLHGAFLANQVFCKWNGKK